MVREITDVECDEENKEKYVNTYGDASLPSRDQKKHDSKNRSESTYHNHFS